MSELKEMEENDINHEKEKEEEVKKVNQIKIILFDILLPLCDLCVDVTKSLMLLFDWQEFQSLDSFANHFHTNGVYGVISLLLKWVPAIVTILHFQDINRLSMVN